MTSDTSTPTPPGAKTWRMKALTDIWTGDSEGKPHRLIATGLLGSVRWWFEVLVRGLGGSACDPTETKCRDQRHCVVCELFGCTGWARKFRFDVLDANGELQAVQIKKDDTFNLHFTPLRPIREVEWALLDLTLRLIAGYGAVGGKTVLKPSDEQTRMSRPNHKDYGLLQVAQHPDLDALPPGALRKHVQGDRWHRVDGNDLAWVSVENFWFIDGRYLGRQSTNGSTFNRVVGRKEPKGQAQHLCSSAADTWLAGKQRESKKVFSFKNPPRTFGFVKPSVIDMAGMRQRLKSAWPNMNDTEVIEGPALLVRLLGSDTGGTP